MLKKLIVGTAVLAMASVAIFGKDAFSYGRTLCSQVRNHAKAEIPLDVEIDRAREMVDNLMPEIRQCLHVIAEQKVEIEQLNMKIARKQKTAETQELSIMALREDLKSGNNSFQYVKTTYSAKEVARELELRFARFKAVQSSLKNDNKILVARKLALEANQKELDKMLETKQELEVKIVQLEARYDTLKASEVASEMGLDNSELARASTLIEQLNRQLDIREKVLVEEGRIAGEIPVEMSLEEDVDVLSEIDAYFESKDVEKAEVADINEL